MLLLIIGEIARNILAPFVLSKYHVVLNFEKPERGTVLLSLQLGRLIVSRSKLASPSSLATPAGQSRLCRNRVSCPSGTANLRVKAAL